MMAIEFYAETGRILASKQFVDNSKLSIPKVDKMPQSINNQLVLICVRNAARHIIGETTRGKDNGES